MRALAFAIVATALAAGCATVSPPKETSGGGAAPTDVRLLEEPDPRLSPVEQLNLARREADEQRSRADAFHTRVGELETEKASLARNLADANRRLAEIEAEVRRSTSREQELTDALLACEIERAKLERRLLEIRLADLQSGKDGHP